MRTVGWWLGLAVIALVAHWLIGFLPPPPRSAPAVVALVSVLRGFGRGALLVLAAFGFLGALATGLLMLLHRLKNDGYATLAKTSDPAKSTDPDMPAGRRGRSDPVWGTGADATDFPGDRAPPTAWSIDLLRQLEWKRIEQLAALYFQALGFKVVEGTAGADGGVDLRLFLPGSLKPGILIQCKAWTRMVGVKEIRELFGVMAAEGVDEGIFLATSSFTAEAWQFARANNIALIGGDDFLRKIGALADDVQLEMLRKITQGDYTTPTCPSCGLKMVSRVANASGTEFWGCPRFPTCRTTLRVARTSNG